MEILRIKKTQQEKRKKNTIKYLMNEQKKKLKFTSLLYSFHF